MENMAKNSEKYEIYGRIVTGYGQYRRKKSWIVKRYEK